MTIYTIYFCPICKSVYTENPRDCKILGWPVLPKDERCKYCGEFLAIEEEKDNPDLEESQ